VTEFRPDDATPTARALAALERIQDRPGVTGDELGRWLGVSSRAARRYVGILRQAGIPVESTPGRHGGYRIGRGFRVPPLMFSTDEALALVMAAVRGRHAVGGAGAAAAGGGLVEAALGKIVRALPSALAEPAEALRRVADRPDREPDGPDPRLASDLARAVQDRCRVRLTYRTHPARPAREMDVDPWGVNLRHDRWYLLCWSHTADARRVLRLDRVEACLRLEEAFDAPDDLDVVEVVDEHLAEAWGLPIEVEVDAPPAEVAARVPRNLGRVDPAPGGRSRLVGSTDDPPWYARQLVVRLEVPFRVVAPPELAAACRGLGERLSAAGGATDLSDGSDESPGADRSA
jgi:predicted DNA-binding transcriptional regulator YafY